MGNEDISNAIEIAKKYNVALLSVRTNRKTKRLEWNNLKGNENDFRITLTEDDKKQLLKKKEELLKELKNENLHDMVSNNIQEIFKFEKKEKNQKSYSVPTKESAVILNKSAELTGLLLKAYGISASQIRRYLDGLRKIKVSQSKETFSSSDVLLQQVKVAYAAGRNRELSFFFDIMKPAIEIGSKDYEHLEQLLRFVEAIIAYHRFYKGEN